MLNINYLKNRMNTIAQPQKKEDEINYVNFEEGKTYNVRFLPMESGSFCEEFYLYYGIAKQFFRCTEKMGKPDPIHEEFLKLQSNPELAGNWKYMKPFKPKLRCAAPVIVKGQEDKGIQVFTFNEKIYGDLINIFIQEKYQNAVDPMNGYDIVIQAYKKDQWLRFNIRGAEYSSQLGLDISVLQDTYPDLSKIYTEYDYERMKDLLRAYNNLNKPQSNAQNYNKAWNEQPAWQPPANMQYSHEEKIKPF